MIKQVIYKMKKMLVDISKRNILFRKMCRNINLVIKKIRYIWYKIKYKMDDETILFEAFGGRNYTCSPKAIYEKMLSMPQFKNFKFVWAFLDTDIHDVKEDKRTTIVKSKSKEYYKYCSIAKYWIVNSIMEESLTKKKGQVYVQCWHGTPIKKLRCDIEVDGSVLNTIKEIRKRNDIDAKRFDYFISPSKYCTEKFISAFNLKKLNKENIIIEEGYPRNDFLFNKTQKDITLIKEKLKIPINKKVIFYLPTFRDNQHTSGIGYTYELQIDFDRLRKAIGDEYVVLFSPHYFIANSIDLSKYEGFVINVARYDEINELYLVSDIIMTDYSSVFFDFANLKRPIVFYMYDYDLYQSRLRDFYISLDELPGPITRTQEELEKCIINIETEFPKYERKYEDFNKKYNYLDDGNASERVIKEIFKEAV
ncbi:MAG TPA: CDP-glycerol glycerophosphotransferase family protein [Clostridiaceae bacterium]|jgi:CDP-glycerol glycerophosphotransferase|nr:CDP-glycerol glycerophosphotransferase family protein [Clostridia bacterium]HBJ12046.1 CDP-glycerol--glycerophosphate glycerophosphotransferase [Clostridiales bacterium]HJJ09130.1 CDP-glycerol glycerophosphotransferase family protein [Clostridiaceae bacterium]